MYRYNFTMYLYLYVCICTCTPVCCPCTSSISTLYLVFSSLKLLYTFPTSTSPFDAYSLHASPSYGIMSFFFCIDPDPYLGLRETPTFIALDAVAKEDLLPHLMVCFTASKTFVTIETILSQIEFLGFLIITLIGNYLLIRQVSSTSSYLA
jgi:hypothetical protein